MNPYFYPLPKHTEHKDCFQKSRQCLPGSVYCVSFIIGKPTPCDNNRNFSPKPPSCVPAGASLIRIAFRCQFMAVAITLTSHLYQPNLKAIQIFLLSIDEYFHQMNLGLLQSFVSFFAIMKLWAI